MKNNRRDFLKTGAAAGAFGLLPQTKPNGLAAKLDKVWAAPVLKTDLIKQPVKIASLELLKNGKHFLVRARSTDGAEGLAVAHTPVVTNTWPILLNKVFPYFIGRDARELESHLHGVYLKDSNYKWQGLPFWVSVACTEIAILDLLGKVAGKPLGALFGEVVRRDIRSIAPAAIAATRRRPKSSSSAKCWPKPARARSSSGWARGCAMTTPRPNATWR